MVKKIPRINARELAEALRADARAPGDEFVNAAMWRRQAMIMDGVAILLEGLEPRYDEYRAEVPDGLNNVHYVTRGRNGGVYVSGRTGVSLAFSYLGSEATPALANEMRDARTLAQFQACIDKLWRAPGSKRVVATQAPD